MYLLPAIDILGGKAVRLAKGDYDRVTVYHDDPAAQAQLFEEQGATWLHVVDLDGARSGIPENIAIVERIMRKTLLKVEVGGGVQYGKLLCAGIDAKGGEVAVAGWREGAGVAAEELARDMSALGFRHLVYTDIARDGMQTGIEAAAYVRMAEAFGHPVIASGGVAGVDDIVRLGEVAGSIEGVIAGRAVYEGALSVQEGVRACDEATRRAEAAAVQANPCGM